MEWTESGFAFRVTFKKVNYKEAKKEKPITTDYDRLTIEEKEVLLYLLDNPKITRKTAVELLKIGETKAKEDIKKLREGDCRRPFRLSVRSVCRGVKNQNYSLLD